MSFAKWLVRNSRGAMALVSALFAALPHPASAGASESGRPVQQMLVFAAASLKGALDEAGADFAKVRGVDLVISYAATPALARQIESGAPADVFISADEAWMDHLSGKALIRPRTRRALLSNRLVLIGAAGKSDGIDVAAAGSIAAALNGGRLALANVAAVPAGRYAKAALEQLGQWTAVEPHLAEAENVRAAMAFVARGEAPLGIVYETDARAQPGIVILAIFPATSHPPIVYPAAVTASAGDPELAAAYLDALSGGAAAAVLHRYGFKVGPSQP